MDKNSQIKTAREWFEKHVSLKGEPYFLDSEQAEAVIDYHKNTIVTARAGSGKTRIIVAKIAYLIVKKHLKPHEIKAFVFNRTAATEINQRLTEVKIDQKPLLTQIYPIATTFHKFALDTLKMTDKNPKIIDEAEKDKILELAIKQNLPKNRPHPLKKILNSAPSFEQEAKNLIDQFINRAEQKFPGEKNTKKLADLIKNYQSDPKNQTFYAFAFPVYQSYLKLLKAAGFIDFNLLMFEATELIEKEANTPVFSAIRDALKPLKYLLVDEYQDFSYLFLNIINQLRKHCQNARLFVVGDDWQAINRFAGSDCDYFINFATFFPEDTTKINLLTNYRSDQKIVENATDYMINATKTETQKITARSCKKGKIKTLNYLKTRFNQNDIKCDALHDANYQKLLKNTKNNLAAAKLLKTTTKIIKHHKNQQILLLHRHNFTSFKDLDLQTFYEALKKAVVKNYFMTVADFEKHVSWLTIHRSKGLEADVVIILEADQKILFSEHQNANLFEIFGDTSLTNKEDQYRLYYVAITRAKHTLYLITSDKKPKKLKLTQKLA